MMLSARAGDAPSAANVDRPPRVLVVDDEPVVRRSIARLLESRGLAVVTAADGAAALAELSSDQYDVALVDMMMPNVGGLELLEQLRARRSDVSIVMMTAFGDVETAVTAVRAGAYHFLTKPFRSDEEVVVTLLKATEHRRLLGHAHKLERKLGQMERLGELIGNAPRMREVYRLALGVAPTSSTVLILGESGTGKELTARAIHSNSPRAERPFIAVNCSAIPADLVESELFGHVRGAFTGATTTREGLFEAANSGTLFLDEVGDLPPFAQVKLLRALQEGEVKRVGANDTKIVDVRVVAATNVDLKSRIAAGKFREDLYYRLNVVAIHLPALRERRDDIPLLAQHFLNKYASRAGRPVRRFTPEALSVLERHDWPGNVRELENSIEYAVVFSKDDAISPAELPMSRDRAPRAADAPPVARDAGLLELPYKEAKERALRSFEDSYFRALLDRERGNVSAAARRAGLDRSNFRRAHKRAVKGAAGDPHD